MILIPNPSQGLGSVTKDQNLWKWWFTWNHIRNPGSVHLLGRRLHCIHWPPAIGTQGICHQPLIFGVHVVHMHAWQRSNGVSLNKVHSTDTLLDLVFCSISSMVTNSFWQMLNVADSLSYPDLLLFRQLSMWNLLLTWQPRPYPLSRRSASPGGHITQTQEPKCHQRWEVGGSSPFSGPGHMVCAFFC